MNNEFRYVNTLNSSFLKPSPPCYRQPSANISYTDVFILIVQKQTQKRRNSCNRMKRLFLQTMLQTHHLMIGRTKAPLPLTIYKY